MTFENFCNYLYVKNKNGKETPLKLTEIQKKFIYFIKYNTNYVARRK